MVNLNPATGKQQIPRPIRSSFYYDVLKKSGRLKQPDSLLRNKTTSYDKHFLVHTDITGSGRGNSYPHRKDFAWNLLFLKQSWGANLNGPKKQTPTVTSPTTDRKTSRGHSSLKRCKYQNTTSTIRNSVKPTSAPNQSLPPLKSRATERTFRSSASNEFAFSAEQRRRRNTGSERSRITLDSIPENEPLKSSRALPSEALAKSRNVSSFENKTSRQTRRSDSKLSRFSATSYSSSLLSSQLPRFDSRITNSATPSSVATSKSYRRESRAASQISRSTRWDEHEGRPLAEKLLAKRKRENKVTNTIKPEIMKTLVNAVTEELNSRNSSTAHLQSKEVGSAISSVYSVKKHQPFTNLKFEVEKSASTTRLRSSLYKTNEELRKPTIFRSIITENQKQKKFNPRYHGEITRPAIVDNHSHKQPIEGFTTTWVPKLNDLNEKKGPWTTYEAAR